MATHDVEKVHQSAVLEHVRDLHAFAGIEAAGQLFVTGVAHAQEEIFTHPLANAAQDVEGEAHAVFQRTAVRPIKVIGQGRPELVHEMPIGLKLKAIQTSGLHALGRVHVILDDALYIPFFHFLREGAV